MDGFLPGLCESLRVRVKFRTGLSTGFQLIADSGQNHQYVPVPVYEQVPSCSSVYLCQYVFYF